jgi:hypothetical protein
VEIVAKQCAERGTQVGSGSGLNPVVWRVNAHKVQDALNIEDIIEYTINTHLLRTVVVLVRILLFTQMNSWHTCWGVQLTSGRQPGDI